MYIGGVKEAPVLSTAIKAQRTILLTAAAFGLVGLLIGVFGAHGVRDRITPDDYRNYEKGVQYHYFFTVMLFVLGILAGAFPGLKNLFAAFLLFSVGIVLFCGSLYVLAISENVLNTEFPRFVFLVTPLGGVCFLIGFVALLFGFAQLGSKRS